MLPALAAHHFALEAEFLVGRPVDFESQDAFGEGDDGVGSRAAFGEHDDVAGFNVRVEEVAGDQVQGFHVDPRVLQGAVACCGEFVFECLLFWG